MKLGFTGTQIGTTKEQKASLSYVLGEIWKVTGIDEFHHGLCIGADEEAHKLIRLLLPRVKIIGHPPIIETKMAKLMVDERRDPLPYLKRNHNIVDETDRLIVCPKDNEITLRSGTCATLRYARRTNKPITIIWPTGDIDEE